MRIILTSLLGFALAWPTTLFAQFAPVTPDSADKSWYTLGFQQTIVYQEHPDFSAKYSGTNSLQTKAEGATSLTASFFLSAKIRPWLTAYFHPELAGGAGVSQAKGAAGYMNGETFRVGNPSPQVYLARGYLNAKRAWGTNGSVQLSVGKFSLADFFDQNNASHDPRSRFLNWGLMSNGAWDYPANVRGYTVGAVLGVQKGNWLLQAGVAQVPQYANGAELDNNIAQNRGHVAEVTYTWNRDTEREANVRLMAFYNLAHMGSYKEAVQLGTAKTDSGTPDITLSRKNGRNKYGFGLSADKKLKGGWILFGRLGYNDGQNETWAFTEIDQTASLGATLAGTQWGREKDVVGVAIAANGISQAHQRYLQHGGLGFMIGDGNLTYAPECAIELFYLIRLHDKHFFLTPDYQFVLNPGYNADRGPVHVFGLRLHTEF